jgi:hypothetical protein
MVMDQGAMTHHRGSSGMKLFGEALAALTIGAMVLAVIGVGAKLPDHALVPSAASHDALGELRCEGRGAIVISVGGKDYAVNGMAASRYPPIQSVWTETSHPEIDIGRLIVQGITLCDW